MCSLKVIRPPIHDLTNGIKEASRNNYQLAKLEDAADNTVPFYIKDFGIFRLWDLRGMEVWGGIICGY